MTQKSARVWNGTEWVEISNTLVSPNAIAAYQNSAPSSPFTGQIWVDADSTINIIDANDYLSKVDATSIYLSQSSASSTYLTQVNASATYLTQSSASSTYLTQTNASATYATISSPGLTGTPTAPTASVGTDNTQIATTAFVYDQAPLFSNRNLLYNGAMQVAQRGTSTASITTSGYFTADRWYQNVSSLGTWTQSVDNDAPTGSGLRKSLKVLCTTADASPAAGDFMYLFQGLEGQDLQRIAKGTSAAQQLTLSFWVKSNVTGTYVVNLQDTDNTRVVSSAYTISASATWEKKTITFAADTTGAFDNDNAGSLYLNFWLGAGSTYTSGTLRSAWTATANGDYAVGQTNLAAATNNYWQVTGVQLEVGPNPTPFEFKSFNQELRECQRYHYRITGDTYARYGSGFNNTTTTGQGVVFLPVTMRAAPSSITTTGTASNYAVFHGAGTITACSAVPTLGATGVTSTTVTLVFTVASGLTAGGACQIISNNNASAFIGFNAEL